MNTCDMMVERMHDNTKQQLDRKNCGRHACSICCGNMCSGSHFCALAGSPMHVCEISMHDMSSHENNPLDMQPHGHDYIQSLDWQTHPARFVHSQQAWEARDLWGL